MSLIFGNSKSNRRGKNRWRYINDANIEAPENRDTNYKPKRCKYWTKIHCYRMDPVTHRIIPLHFISGDMYICETCRQREKIDRWFANLQRTEIPSTLEQFRRLKGRIRYNLNDDMPPNTDSCWKFYSIMADYE